MLPMLCGVDAKHPAAARRAGGKLWGGSTGESPPLLSGTERLKEDHAQAEVRLGTAHYVPSRLLI